jgi:hypothetical protein
MAEHIYKILVDSIRVDILGTGLAKSVAKLRRENEAFHDGLKLTRLAWLSRGTLQVESMYL